MFILFKKNKYKTSYFFQFLQKNEASNTYFL